MIAHVTGRVAALAPEGAVLDVGGVGFFLQCTPGTLAELRAGQSATLATSLVVREDSLTLFGFATDDERTIFELVQTVTGVGPRLAQAIIGVHAPDALRRIVATEDIASLTQVPGIGRKGAQRILLELKDKLGAPTTAVVDLRTSGAGHWQEQVHGALLGLGWSVREADDAISSVSAEMASQNGEQLDTNDIGALLRSALRILGPR